MTRHSNPARFGPTSHGPREQGEAATFPAASPELLTPSPLILSLSKETQAWIRAVNRRCDQASLLLILIAVLWFGTASIGAALP